MRLDPAWLVGVAPRGIVCARGEREVVLGLEAPLDALVELLHALARGEPPETLAAVAGTPVEEARRALDALRAHGVLVDDDAPERPRPAFGVPLAEAIADPAAAVAAGGAWTADELLVLPAEPAPEAAKAAVRAFVAALRPDARVEAYAALAVHEQATTTGDVADPDAVAAAAQAARAADPEAVHAVDLGSARRWSVAPQRLRRLDMRAPHRLGPLQDVRAAHPGPPLAGRRASFVAEYAVGNLVSPWSRTFRIGRGTAADADHAELVARAEAAERYGAYEVDPSRLRQSRAAELDAPHVAPDALMRFSARQYEEHDDLAPYRPDWKLPWMRATTRRGETRWVPAEAVHVGLSSSGRPRALVTSSSGLAAGPTPADAADRALRELIERDAFMWTWVQRVSRERIDLAGVDPEAADLARAIEASGYEVSLVNLTLDTKPVILSVLHSHERVHVAAACRESPREAAAKALDETALVLSLEGPHEPPALSPRDVETPEDHMWLHLRPEGVERASFLWASDETIGLDEVSAAPGPVDEVVEVVGEALTVDLTSPRTAPFHVARALVPGLVPISFGWDREPLGMARLAAPVDTVDGRRLGADLNADDAPILPHPFP